MDRGWSSTRNEVEQEKRGDMLILLAITFSVIVVTIVIHVGAMRLALQVIKRERKGWVEKIHQMPVNKIAIVVIIMFLASLLEVLVWAAVYLSLNAIGGVERAVYFSMVTYTTLGYGDVLLPEGWRLLGSFEAANGIIMFGWTTAIVMVVVQKVYFGPQRGDKEME
jgi:hypothetical protein